MPRPRRLYKDNKGRYFYIVNNQQKFVKVPKDMTEKDVVKISLKTLENLINKRRVKRRKKRANYKYETGIVKGAPEVQSKLVVEGRKITQIEDIIKNTKQKKAEQLAENVETFFDTLANKKSGLLSGTQLVKQEEKGMKQGKEADKEAPSPNQEEGSIKNLDSKLKKIAKNIIKLAGSGKGWDDVYSKGMNFESASYGDFVNQALKLFEDVNEDERKILVKTLKNNSKLQNNWIETFNRLVDEGIEERDKKPAEPIPEPAQPTEPKPPAKPASEQIKNIKKAIRTRKTTEDLMPSLKTKPKTTEEKLATTPSFSGTTPSGTAEPAAPMSTTSTSPLPESIVEKIRKEIEEEEKARGLMGLGDDGDNGLYNDEIAKIIKKRVGKVIPVIPSDKVKYLKDYVEKGDKNFAAVINTNPSNSDGSGNDGFRPGHWRAIFINNEDDYPSIEYFDPLVSVPEKELVIELKKIAKKMNPEHMFLYKENRLQRQAKEASTCGYHAAQFIDDRMNGESWCQATGYDDFINRMGSADDSKDGEADIRKTIKKYKVYL